MSKAHINSRLSLSDVLVPTDNDTVGLWHFDRHLQSTNGIRPAWNICRLSSGKFGTGVVVQENTENLSGNITTYTAQHYDGLTSDSIVTDTTPLGSMQCRKVECVSLATTDTAFHLRSDAVTVLADSQYTMSFYAKTNDASVSTWPISNSNYATTIQWFDSTSTLISRTTFASNQAFPTNQWKRFTITGTAPATASTCKIYIGMDWPNFTAVGSYILVTAVQLEHKAYVTPYVQTSIVNEKLSYQVFAPYTISCYFKLGSIETRSTVGDNRIILWYAKVDNSGNYYNNVSSWKVYIPGGSTTLRLECYNYQQLATKTLDITSATLNIYDDNWHYMCIRFNGTNIEFKVDNITRDLTANLWTSAPVFHTQKIGIGCDPEGFLRSANVYVDELRCDKTYVQTKEIEAWMASTRPFYDPYDYSIIESSLS